MPPLPLSLIPEAGPHAVGLHIVQQYDYRRAMEVQLDAFGKPLPVGRGRAIQTLVWYPARKVAGPRMQVVEYREASLSDVDFAFSGVEAARLRAA